MKRPKILITGGAGFIGSHLAQRLCGRHRIVIFDNLRRDSLKGLPGLKNHPNVEFIKGDMLNNTQLSKALRGCRTILHLAAIAGVSSYYKEPAATLRVNLVGTVNLFEMCKNLNIKKFIYFSTSEVYGRNALNVNEESDYRIGPINDPRWCYAVSKVAGEHLAVRYGEEYAFKAFVVRPFNIYGPRQTGEGAISNFFKAAVHGRAMAVNGDGSPVRAWCYISDCVDAVQKMVENDKLPGGVFNIGNPRAACTTLELAKAVRKVVGMGVPIIYKEMRRTEIIVRVPDIKKAQRQLGFAPKISLEKGLGLTYEFFKTEGAKG